jgi:hypothetical protein
MDSGHYKLLAELTGFPHGVATTSEHTVKKLRCQMCTVRYGQRHLANNCVFCFLLM